MSSNLKNSIWPNGMQVDADGYASFTPLGENKVDIPTTEDAWPVGDKLISPFVYKNNKLVGFCDTKAMTANSGATITMPYEHIEADFSSIEEGTVIVDAPNAITKKFIWAVADCGNDNFVLIRFEDMDEDTKSLLRSAVKIVDNVLYDGNDNEIGTFETNRLATGSNVMVDEYDGYYSTDEKDRDALFTTLNIQEGWYSHYRDVNLTIFNSDLSSLTNGYAMFKKCSNLESFTSNLSSLIYGTEMFYETPIYEFSTNMDSLIYGDSMFSSCANLEVFDFDVPLLKYANSMFSWCTNLSSFTGDLSSLEDGYSMFDGCSSLTTFESKLSSLTNGTNMFTRCKLSASSVRNIYENINNFREKGEETYGYIVLGIGYNNTTSDKNIFASESGFGSISNLLLSFENKGWTVEGYFTGRPSSSYGLRNNTSEEFLPVFVKLEEVSEDSRCCDYVSIDGSKKYNLKYFHITSGSTEGYTQFNSLEEAIETFNIKPIERN